MKRNNLLDKIRKYRARYIGIFVDYTFDLSARIQFLLDSNSMDQKDLAKALGKNESEISKWLSGSHNFTFKTVAKIEDVLNAKLLQVVSNDEIQNIQKVEVLVLQQKQVFTPSFDFHNQPKLSSYSTRYTKKMIADC